MKNSLKLPFLDAKKVFAIFFVLFVFSWIYLSYLFMLLGCDFVEVETDFYGIGSYNGNMRNWLKGI